MSDISREGAEAGRADTTSVRRKAVFADGDDAGQHDRIRLAEETIGDRVLEDGALEDGALEDEAEDPSAMIASDAIDESAEPAVPDEPEEDEPEEIVEPEDELPEVPELQGPEAVARVAFVLPLSQREGMSLLRLAQAMNTTQAMVEQGLEHLARMLVELALPAEIGRTESTVRLLSAPEAHAFLTRLRGVKKQEKLSQAALETLAVIAYRQPVLRSEIEAIRGVKAGPMLRMLLQHKLVKVTGRADVPGRPLQYGTTPHFLERFGLHSLKDLPSIQEFKQLG